MLVTLPCIQPLSKSLLMRTFWKGIWFDCLVQFLSLHFCTTWVTTCSIQPSWISCMSLYFLILTLIKLYLKNYHTFIRLFLISPNIFIVSAMCLLGIHVLALPCGIKRLATWAYVFSYNYLTGSLLRNRLYIIYIVFIFILWEKLKTLSLFKNAGCLNVTLCC